MIYLDKKVALSELVGKTIKEITGLEKGSEEVRIFTECGQEYLFYHRQRCCEHVELNDFEGEAGDLIGALITGAEVVTNECEGEKPDKYPQSWTWSFYKTETNKGGLWMRWLGGSNGYYSEIVDFVWVNKTDCG